MWPQEQSNIQSPSFGHRKHSPTVSSARRDETNGQLQGVIIHVPYESLGAYRALSYVWDKDQRTKELATPDGTLQITCSLNNALQR
jgi:hypothetical protein